MPCQLPLQDKKLVQIVDAALLAAEWRSGDRLICKPGCTGCCIGVFAIDQLDMLRLRDGLAHLDTTDPERAARVRQRARESWERVAPTFPGDVHSGVLDDDDKPPRSSKSLPTTNRVRRSILIAVPAMCTRGGRSPAVSSVRQFDPKAG